MAATERELFERLEILGIKTTTCRHPPVFTVADHKNIPEKIPGGHCKSLFLKDKTGALFLVVALQDTAIDLKTLQQTIGAARLSG